MEARTRRADGVVSMRHDEGALVAKFGKLWDTDLVFIRFTELVTMSQIRQISLNLGNMVIEGSDLDAHGPLRALRGSTSCLLSAVAQHDVDKSRHSPGSGLSLFQG